MNKRKVELDFDVIRFQKVVISAAGSTDLEAVKQEAFRLQRFCQKPVWLIHGSKEYIINKGDTITEHVETKAEKKAQQKRQIR